eukprot:TRINITY_DN4232_c0_g1_i1.p1 TRINITY_DN4232_c0_g1~~TRINITY_DN4232_c0_g1_i1.p1  ORF type:complete len:190 (-),score=56.41 TRINITY_DN4232_c0_g1_i1:449-1018(-)
MEKAGVAEGAERSWPSGFLVGVKTLLGEKFDAEIVMYDKATSIVVLQDPGSSGTRRNLRFLKTSIVEEVTILSEEPKKMDLHIVQVDPAVLLAREEAAIRQAEAEAQHIGRDVTTEAQELYDALRKTLPVRWEGKSIVVMDDVRISPPYLPEDIVGGDQGVLERVRKVWILSLRNLKGRDPDPGRHHSG